MKNKTVKRNKKVCLADLEKMAFPEHVVTLRELRKHAYAEKVGDNSSSELIRHIQSCKHCQKQLEFLKQTDPVLTGEEDSRVKVLVQTPDARVDRRRA